ncbi:MAG: hypothetical protein V1824_00060 [archaeon]
MIIKSPAIKKRKTFLFPNLAPVSDQIAKQHLKLVLDTTRQEKIKQRALNNKTIRESKTNHKSLNIMSKYNLPKYIQLQHKKNKELRYPKTDVFEACSIKDNNKIINVSLNPRKDQILHSDKYYITCGDEIHNHNAKNLIKNNNNYYSNSKLYSTPLAPSPNDIITSIFRNVLGLGSKDIIIVSDIYKNKLEFAGKINIVCSDKLLEILERTNPRITVIKSIILENADYIKSLEKKYENKNFNIEDEPDYLSIVKGLVRYLNEYKSNIEQKYNIILTGKENSADITFEIFSMLEKKYGFKFEIIPNLKGGYVFDKYKQDFIKRPIYAKRKRYD